MVEELSSKSFRELAVECHEFSGPMVQVSARLKRLVADLKARNLKVFLQNANSPEIVRVAITTGMMVPASPT
jgi:hypothetical protein